MLKTLVVVAIVRYIAVQRSDGIAITLALFGPAAKLACVSLARPATPPARAAQSLRNLLGAPGPIFVTCITVDGWCSPFFARADGIRGLTGHAVGTFRPQILRTVGRYVAASARNFIPERTTSILPKCPKNRGLGDAGLTRILSD